MCRWVLVDGLVPKYVDYETFQAYNSTHIGVHYDN
jgi:hypothetical protein